MYDSPSRCNVKYRFFFFFQAEDGIRDSSVTGVQTCALPIFGTPWPAHEIKGTQLSSPPLERAMSLETARRVLTIEAQAIQDVLARLDASFEKAVEVLFACKGRVVVSGMGKSGLIARKISSTLSSTGTP